MPRKDDVLWLCRRNPESGFKEDPGLLQSWQISVGQAIYCYANAKTSLASFRAACLSVNLPEPFSNFQISLAIIKSLLISHQLFGSFLAPGQSIRLEFES